MASATKKSLRTMGAAVAALCFSVWLGQAAAEQANRLNSEQTLLGDIRQITLLGKRAGEGYFSPNGRQMIFQSEREPGNPFYQMYLLNRDTGDIHRVSPGIGKATCGWIHPLQQKAMFSSTQDDPDWPAKLKAEQDARAAGGHRRYSWDFDDAYEIYEVDFTTGKYTNLTNSPGYDAEGSYSPDGRQIVFASNRDVYNRPLSAKEKALFDRDKSAFMDIYIMNADGSNVRRLTSAPGYDGGPFFSADGHKIVWRRFAADGRISEIYTMNADGSDQRQITRLGHMSWAPFFHPSGDYIIFASNRYGDRNFELFIIDAAGLHEPVRITDSAGFDGLPAFTPDGEELAWTSSRTANGKSQIFLAEWNDAAARRLLDLPQHITESQTKQKPVCGVCQARLQHLRWHVATLSSEEMQGRLTGTEGEKRATQYVANVFRLIGLAPAGENGSYFQPFTFTAGVSLGPLNRMAVTGTGSPIPAVDENWRPLAFSNNGAQEAAPVVFAGYGIEAPATRSEPGYNSFEDADVKDKWVMVFRGMPAGLTPERRLKLSRFADNQYKASVAKAKGAIGIIFVPAPGIDYMDELIKLSQDAVGGQSSIAALSIDRKLFNALVAPFGDGFSQVIEGIERGEKMRATEIPGIALAAGIDIVREMKTGLNVLGRLKTGATGNRPPLLIGAHVDHLGLGNVSGSLAREDEKGKIHYGADDNASGVAALLEIAEGMAGLAKQGHLEATRDVIFAAWSGEELGLLGSTYFVDKLAAATNSQDLSPFIDAYLNLDMIGRLDKRLSLMGVGSSTVWPHIIERANILAGLQVDLVEDPYVPSDATSFYLKGVPVLHAYTGAHEDYSTPRDSADKVNYMGLAKITTLIDGISKQLLASQRAPDFIRMTTKQGSDGARRHAAVSLGTIPDYAAKDIKGIKLSGLMKGGPAEKAGLQSGDVITRLADMPIDNIYDYVRAINMLRPGTPVDLQVDRNGSPLTLSLVPAPRE